MKLCIPIEEKNGMDSICYGHFGSAPAFCVVDTEAEEKLVGYIDNANEHHEHGMCNPVGAIAGKGISGIIVCGMGARAVQLMNQNGIKVYYAPRQFAVREIFDNYEFKFQEMRLEDSCQSHHGCGH